MMEMLPGLQKSYDTIQDISSGFSSAHKDWNDTFKKAAASLKARDADNARQLAGRVLDLVLKYFKKHTKPEGGDDCVPIGGMQKLASDLKNRKAKVDESRSLIKKDDEQNNKSEGNRHIFGDSMANYSREVGEWNVAVLYYKAIKIFIWGAFAKGFNQSIKV